MRELNIISDALFEKIRARFENVSLGNKDAYVTQNPAHARFFNFDFVTVAKKTLGNITISIADGAALKIYYNRGLTKNLPPEEKTEWEEFLKNLRIFSKKNMLIFEPRDITRTIKLRDIYTLAEADDKAVVESIDNSMDPPGYAERVAELEAEGMTTSDAQGVADMEFKDAGRNPNLSAAQAAFRAPPPMTLLDVKAAWMKVFPNSSVIAREIMGDAGFVFRLSAGASECANNIAENDPLYYRAFLRNGNFEESGCNLFINPPAGSNLVYSSAKCRKATIKNVTVDKLLRRFAQIKEFVAANADNTKNLKFDIHSKLNESRLYGTRKSSYENPTNEVRLIVRHSAPINLEERGARTRHIRAIYIENIEGERFKLPQNNLKYARAMARHVSEGGVMHDDFGKHITQIAEECAKLRPFRSGMRGRLFDDVETQSIVEAAFEYHSLLNNTLKRISGRKGYKHCKETFTDESSILMDSEDSDISKLRERFVKRVFNDKMEAALPIVQKAYNMKKLNEWDTDPDEDHAQRSESLEACIEMQLEEMNVSFPISSDEAERIAEIIEDASSSDNSYGISTVSADEVIEYFEARGCIKDAPKESQYAQQFESWANTIVEGTWAIPDTPEKIEQLKDILSSELIVGVEAQNAQGVLGNLIGDDDLFDLLGDISDDSPEADVAPAVRDWLARKAPVLYEKLGFNDDDIDDKFDTERDPHDPENEDSEEEGENKGDDHDGWVGGVDAGHQPDWEHDIDEHDPDFERDRTDDPYDSDDPAPMEENTTWTESLNQMRKMAGLKE